MSRKIFPILLVTLVSISSPLQACEVDQSEVRRFESSLTREQREKMYRVMLKFDARYDSLPPVGDDYRVSQEFRLRRELGDAISEILTERQKALWVAAKAVCT